MELDKKTIKEIIKNLKNVQKMYEQGLKKAKINPLERRYAISEKNKLDKLIDMLQNG